MTEKRKRYYKYLSELRQSGVVNMLGAGVWLVGAFPELSRSQARNVLTSWMKTFGKI